MTTNEIYTAILAGQADDGLDRILHALSERRKTLAHRTFDSLADGDRVMVTAKHIKPRYLDGAMGTVVEKRISKVTIQFDDDINDPYGKWAGKRCILDPTHLIKVEPDVEVSVA